MSVLMPVGIGNALLWEAANQGTVAFELGVAVTLLTMSGNSNSSTKGNAFLNSRSDSYAGSSDTTTTGNPGLRNPVDQRLLRRHSATL